MIALIPWRAEHAPSLPGGEIELDEGYFGGLRKGNRGRGVNAKVRQSSASRGAKGLAQMILAPDVSIGTLLSVTEITYPDLRP